MDESLYFANVAHFKDRLKEIGQSESGLNTVILNCFAINRVDSSALHALAELVTDLHAQGVRLLMVGVKGPVNDRLKKAGLVERIGADHFFLEVHEAALVAGCSEVESPSVDVTPKGPTDTQYYVN